MLKPTASLMPISTSVSSLEIMFRETLFVVGIWLNETTGLEKLYRENVKLSEEVAHIIEGKSNEMNLLDSIKVLAALKESSEKAADAQSSSASVSAQRNPSGKQGRANKKGSSSKASSSAAASAVRDTTDELPAAPSPKISLNPSRLAREKPSRAGSVSVTRETSVKLEDGAESVASSADGVASSTAGLSNATANGSTRPTQRIKLTKGEIVFCRHGNSSAAGADPPEGEGILCRVTLVIGEGKQRRYEVQDADTSGDPPPPQRASIQQLIQIPSTNAGLPELAKGRSVLAQYPDTTTFYKAEVMETWRSGPGGDVKLTFEEDTQTREVERRFVLTEK